jgi:DNA polymerase-3 subunit epsilon
MFEWLKSKLQLTAVMQAKVPAPPLPQATVTVMVTGPTGQGVPVSISGAEIADRASAHAFVLDLEPPPLKTADQWWEEESQNRRLREGSNKAYAWLSPFVPREFAKLEQLKKVMQQGPHGATELAKAVRAIVREKRKAKEPHTDLLKALYGACVLADVSASLGFEGTQPHYMARFVSLEELEQVQCDYATLGYQFIQALGKTDIKWLVEAFGEPAEHQSFDAAFPNVRRNAVARYCWAQVRSYGRLRDASINPKTAMQEWLNELVKRNIGYHKEWQERVAARTERLTEQSMGIAAAWAATNQPYAVADLETTGLSAATDEILEFAAILVEPDGAVTAEFSLLVRADRPVPAAITKLTGITQSDIDNTGVPLPIALVQFLAFVGDRPVFFHNASFDAGFLKQAAALTELKFANTVHDTLPMARAAWPTLGSYRLSVLAEHVGAPAPNHRGLADVKATLAVILAARR